VCLVLLKKIAPLFWVVVVADALSRVFARMALLNLDDAQDEDPEHIEDQLEIRQQENARCF
jgi:hypothetical protein